MTKYFYLSTRLESRWTEAHAEVGYKPVLNDLPGKGDLVHNNFDAACRLAQDIDYDLPGAKGLDVIEITVDDDLVAALMRSGDITTAPQSDCFGNPLTKLSSVVCGHINGAASFAKKEFLIPEAHLAALSDTSRNSATMH